MRPREKQVWEAKSHLNGERVVVVLESRAGDGRYGECTVHKCLHITGKRLGRILEWTEQEDKWDKDPTMKRLA